jgi:hypothetical protein
MDVDRVGMEFCWGHFNHRNLRWQFGAESGRVSYHKSHLRGHCMRINDNARQSREDADDEADVRGYGGGSRTEGI